MNIESIQSFISIVHNQTVSAAARELFVSQSTVSHRIQMLEKELGITLFIRQRGFKRLELTESGKRFYPLAIQWLELHSRMQDIRQNTSVGKVCIGSMDSINHYLISPIIQEIHSENPELELELVSYHSHEIYTRINAHVIDVGFAFNPLYYDFVAKPVFSEPVYIVSLKDSIYTEDSLHPSDLQKRNQVYFTWSDELEQWNNEWWDEQAPPYIRVDSIGLLMSFLTAPDLWAVCPASAAINLQMSYHLKIHTLRVPVPNRITYMIYRKTRKNSEPLAVRTFIDAFSEKASTHSLRYQKNVRQHTQL